MSSTAKKELSHLIVFFFFGGKGGGVLGKIQTHCKAAPWDHDDSSHSFYLFYQYSPIMFYKS